MLLGGEAGLFGFYFSLSQEDRRNTELLYFYRKGDSVTVLKPQGSEQVKYFVNWQFSFPQQQLPLSSFHVCCLGFFLFLGA